MSSDLIEVFARGPTSAAWTVPNETPSRGARVRSPQTKPRKPPKQPQAQPQTQPPPLKHKRRLFSADGGDSGGGAARRRWRFLFASLRSVLDEAYDLCSSELATAEASAMVDALRRGVDDFVALQRKLDVILEFDPASPAPPSPTPASAAAAHRGGVAWEELKPVASPTSRPRTAPADALSVSIPFAADDAAAAELATPVSPSQQRTTPRTPPRRAVGCLPELAVSPGLGFSHAFELTSWADEVENEEELRAAGFVRTAPPPSPPPPPPAAETEPAAAVVPEEEEEKKRPPTVETAVQTSPALVEQPVRQQEATAATPTQQKQHATTSTCEASVQTPPVVFVAPPPTGEAHVEVVATVLPTPNPHAHTHAHAVGQPCPGGTTASQQQQQQQQQQPQPLLQRRQQQRLSSVYIPNHGDTFAERVKRSLRAAAPAPAVQASSAAGTATTTASPPRPTVVVPPGTCPSRDLETRLAAETHHTDSTELAQRMEKAQRNREQLAQAQAAKAKQLQDRLRLASERKSQKMVERQQSLAAQREKAGQIHESYLRQKVQRAERELEKVREVAWVSSEQQETQKFVVERELSTRMEEASARKAEMQEDARQKAAQRAAKEQAAKQRKKALRQQQQQQQQQAHKAKASEVAAASSQSTSQCAICGVSLPSEDLERHLTSPEHLQRVKEKAAACQPTAESAPSVIVPQLRYVEEPATAPRVDVPASEDATRVEDEKAVARKACASILSELRSSSKETTPGDTAQEEKSAPSTSASAVVASQAGISHLCKFAQDLRSSLKKKKKARHDEAAPRRGKRTPAAAAPLEGTLKALRSALDGEVRALPKPKPGELVRSEAVFAVLEVLLAGIADESSSAELSHCTSSSADLLESMLKSPEVRAAVAKSAFLPDLLEKLDKLLICDGHGRSDAPLLPVFLRIVASVVSVVPLCPDSRRLSRVVEFVLQSALLERIFLKLRLCQQALLSPSPPGTTGKSSSASASSSTLRTGIELSESALSFLAALSAQASVGRAAFAEPCPDDSRLLATLRSFVPCLASLLLSLLMTGRKGPEKELVRSATGLPFAPIESTELSARYSPLTSDTLRLATVGLRLYNNVAVADLRGLQAVLSGAEDLRMELGHLITFVLRSCVQPDSVALPPDETRQVVTEAILLVGYLSLDCPALREVFRWGPAPSILQLLCTLPVEYLVDPDLRAVLLPTLAAMCVDDLPAAEQLSSEMSPSVLAEFLEEEINNSWATAHPLISRLAHLPASAVHPESVDTRVVLAARLQRDKWQPAAAFFRSLDG